MRRFGDRSGIALVSLERTVRPPHSDPPACLHNVSPLAPVPTDNARNDGELAGNQDFHICGKAVHD